jgi:hypothetical protein
MPEKPAGFVYESLTSFLRPQIKPSNSGLRPLWAFLIGSRPLQKRSFVSLILRADVVLSSFPVFTGKTCAITVRPEVLDRVVALVNWVCTGILGGQG